MRNIIKNTLLILLFFILISCEEKIEYSNKSFKYQIESLGFDKNVEGNFVLGSGSIREVDYYYFLIRDSAFNGYTKYKIKALNTLIIEKDTIPVLIHNKVRKVSTKKSLLKFIDDKIKTTYFEDKVKTTYFEYSSLSATLEGVKIPRSVGYENVLIVPKGTVTENVKWEAL